MKKSARKLITLVLSLVLVCTCAATAFAHTHIGSYDFNGGVVEEHATIGQFDIYGQIVVEDASGLNSNTNIRRVTMEVWYITEDSTGEPTTCKWAGSLSNTSTRPAAEVSKVFTVEDIPETKLVSLSYANVSYAADVYNGSTTQRYTHGPLYISYIML